MLIPDASDEFNKTYNLEQFSHIPNVVIPGKNLTGTGQPLKFRQR